MVSIIPENDLIKIRKYFSGRTYIFLGNKNKFKKVKVGTISWQYIFLRTYSPRLNRQLKQDVQANEEELTLYRRKAGPWKCVHIKKAKTAAHAHAKRENSSDFKFKKI